MLVALILLAAVGTEAFQICPGRCNYQLPTAKRHTALFRSSSQSITMASAKEVDCLVIGGGVSGISAAVYADKGGAKILLAEKAPQLGGVIETRERDTVQWVLLVSAYLRACLHVYLNRHSYNAFFRKMALIPFRRQQRECCGWWQIWG